MRMASAEVPPVASQTRAAVSSVMTFSSASITAPVNCAPPVPGFITEIVPLLHALHLAGRGIELGRHILAVRMRHRLLLLGLFGVRLRLGLDAGGAERFQPISRPVRHRHLLGVQPALTLN